MVKILCHQNGFRILVLNRKPQNYLKMLSKKIKIKNTRQMFIIHINCTKSYTGRKRKKKINVLKKLNKSSKLQLYYIFVLILGWWKNNLFISKIIFLPTRNKFIYASHIEIRSSEVDKVSIGGFSILLVFEAFFAQEVIEVLEKVVVGGRVSGNYFGWFRVS